MSRICEVWRLGVVAYSAALDLQNRLVAARIRDEAPDRLLLLTHPHTFTFGSAARDAHLLWDETERQRRGVTVQRGDRGGDVTYHGPGQLVAYPIIRLNAVIPDYSLRRDVIGYVRGLEQVVIGALADYGIVGMTIAGLTGVWVDTPDGTLKVCAVGVRVTARAVTKHGFALNLNTDLSYFGGIVPCGIHDRGVTSVAALLGGAVDEDEAAGRIMAHFGRVFGYEVQARATLYTGI